MKEEHSMYVKDKYNKLSDAEIVSLVVDEGNQEALTYLLYEKYYGRFCFLANRYYGTLFYLEDLIIELYLRLKGKKGDWKVLNSFQGKSSFETWLCRVASNLFLEKRPELIGFAEKTVSIDGTDNNGMVAGADSDDSIEEILLLEAINRLENQEYKFILLKGLEGYLPAEISQMLTEQRRKEGRMKYRSNETEIIPTADYIYMIKPRALKEVSNIMNLLEKEWL